MVKRAVIGLSGGNVIFRVSKPGINVDTASASQLLLDERVFYGQVYASGYAALNSAPSGIATINYPSLGYVPYCLCYNVFSTGEIVYPSYYRYQIGGSTFPAPVTLFRAYADKLLIDLNGAPNVVGAYYVVFRRTV